MSNMSEAFDYIAYMPENGQTAEKLVFLCHGYGFNAHFMEKQAMEIQKQCPQAKVIIPHAPSLLDPLDDTTEEESGLRVPKQVVDNDMNVQDMERRQWFSIKGGDMAEITKRSLHIAAKFNTFVDRQRDEHGLTDKDIAFMGLSQGGNICLTAAYTRPNPIACVIGHSTLLTVSPDFQSKPKTLFIYGTADEEFPESVYEGITDTIEAYCGEVDITVVEGLGHKTNQESRERTAQYIKSQFAI